MKAAKTKKGFGQQIYTTILLALVALVGITAATAAWFSIADVTHVGTLRMDITSGVALRFDVNAHSTFEEYQQTLSFDRIADHVQGQLGYDMRSVPLEPVTTEDGRTYTLRSGAVEPNTSGAYWEFTLHFSATDDMFVHLTTAPGPGQDDGTRITSDKEALPESMRLAFTVDGQTMIYDPGMGDSAIFSGEVKKFGLPSAGNMVYNDKNVLFSIAEGEDKPVLVHIWMEGTDEACTDELKNSDFAIQMRFEGTDENGNRIDGRTQSA